MSKGGFENEFHSCQKQHWGETLLPAKCFKTQQPKQMLQLAPNVLQALHFLSSHAPPFLSLPFMNTGLEGGM